MLRFYYGTMASGKSATLLMSVYQRKQNGMKCGILKPTEKRDKDKVKSRIGLESECITFSVEDNLEEILKYLWVEKNITHVFIDECQFLTKEQVKQIWSASCNLGIDVSCFGLKTTYKNELFKSVETLMVYADKIIELEPSAKCKYCNNDANTHLLKINDKVVLDFPEKFEGDIEGSTRFECVCQSCWHKLTKNNIV